MSIKLVILIPPSHNDKVMFRDKVKAFLKSEICVNVALASIDDPCH